MSFNNSLAVTYGCKALVSNFSSWTMQRGFNEIIWRYGMKFYIWALATPRSVQSWVNPHCESHEISRKWLLRIIISELLGCRWRTRANLREARGSSRSRACLYQSTNQRKVISNCQLCDIKSPWRQTQVFKRVYAQQWMTGGIIRQQKCRDNTYFSVLSSHCFLWERMLLPSNALR